VEFVLAIDAALDFVLLNGLHDGGNAGQKVVLLFLGFKAGVKAFLDLAQARVEGRFCPLGNLIPHEDADRIDLRPFTIQGE
jgi:hypothetical protein